MALNPRATDAFAREEQAYWALREELLRLFPGQWVAVVGGEVVAVGTDSSEVIREAIRKTGRTTGYVGHVGQEDEVYRIRRVHMGHYDRSRHRPIPMMHAAVSHITGTGEVAVALLVDTGADLTVLSADVADAAGLWDCPWRTARIAGVGAKPEARTLYVALVNVAGQEVLVEADCRDDLAENIMGRDVINEFSLTVCAKRDQVTFEHVPNAM